MLDLDEQIRLAIDAGAPPVTASEVMVRGRGTHRTARLVPGGRTPSNRYLIRALVTVAAVIVLVLVLVLGFRGTSKPGGVTPAHQNKNSGPGVTLRFVPEGQSSASGLKDDVSILTKRLATLGLGDSAVSKSHGSITIWTPKPASKTALADIVDLTSPGTVYLRPVLCSAPPFSLGAGKAPGAVPNRCPPQNQLSAANLDVDTNSGTTEANPVPWVTLASVPSTSSSSDNPSEPVLLVAPSDAYPSGQRLLLGPAGVTGSEITGAQSVFDSPDWVINVDFNRLGASQWNALALQQFHALIAVDLNGHLLEAPLTEPSQTVFTSFAGKVQFSGPWNENESKVVAAELNAGPLPVHLVEKHG
jgi:hypothetical protein